MGNTILCRNTTCTQPRPVYKTVLTQIFQMGWEKPRVDSSSTKNNSIDHNETINRNPSEIVVDIPKLQAHVNSHIKGLIDYLEGSHKKLVDTGSYIQKVVTGTFNPDIHMLGLLVIIELIKASPKFTHDKNFLEKLHQRATNEEFIKAEGNDKPENKLPSKPIDLESSSFADYGTNLKDNVAYFDNCVVETLAFLLDEKRNNLRKSSYRYTLKTLDLYAKHHPNTLTNDKMEIIMTDALEMIESYQSLNIREDLEVEHDFMTLLVTLAKSNNVAFKFKHKFINHSYKTLKSIYEIQSNGAAVELGSLGNKEIEQQIVKLAFEFIETISQSVYDLNEFGILISPLFIFLDNLEWQDNQLQADIFLSLLNSMNNSSFDQADIVVIEKIVEYINFNKKSSAVVVNPYKHNEDIEVKIRVFSLLSTILEKTKKTFITFLDVNKITLTFINNLKPVYMTKPESDKLREAIYECQKRFIEKINNSAQNLSQILNLISSQMNKSQENKESIHTKEILDFFSFTINYISYYPSQVVIPKETVIAINKIRNIPELLSKTYHPMESLLYLKHQGDEILTPGDKNDLKKGDLLLCPPDIAYPILSNNLSVLRTLIEVHQKQTRGETNGKIDEFKTLTLFILHCKKINYGFLYRKDTILLSILTSFFRKILTVSTKENLNKQSSGLLLYSVYSFLKKTQELWSIGTLAPYMNTLAQKLPNDAIQTLEKQKDLSTQDIQTLLDTFGSIEYANPNDFLQEYEILVDIIAVHLKQNNPGWRVETLKEDFEEMQSNYSSNIFISVDEGDSIDHTRSLLVSATPKPVPVSAGGVKRTHQKHGSLADIYSIQQASIIRNGNASKIEESHNSDSQASSFIDHSFEQKLQTAKQNKINTNNLTNILNNQI